MDRRGQLESADKGFGFTSGGAVADGDGLDIEVLDKSTDLFRGVLCHALGKDHIVVEKFTLLIEKHDFAAGANSGVDRHDGFLTQRRGEQQLAEIVGEDFDTIGIEAHLGFERGEEEAFARLLHRETHLI